MKKTSVIILVLALLAICSSAHGIKLSIAGSDIAVKGAWYDVRYRDATGDGVTDDRAAINNAATDASSGMLFFPATEGSATYLIGTNLTLDETLWIGSGAVLKPDAGITLTLTGQIVDTNDQIFDLSAGGVVDLSGAALRTYNVRWWGATGNGTTDDTTACQHAIDAAELVFISIEPGSSYGAAQIAPVVYFPPGQYLLTGLLVESNVTLQGAGSNVTILKTASNRPVIDIAHIYDDGDVNYKKDMFQYVSDFTIFGDSTAAEAVPAKPDQCAIRFAGDCTHVERIWVSRMAGDGFVFSSGITSLLRDCEVSECFNGTGVEIYSSVTRIPVVAVGLGGPLDGADVIGSASGSTATVKHYWANTLTDTAGDIELYDVSGNFDRGENIQVFGDATTYVTVSNVGTNSINLYYYKNNTSMWVRENKFRWNKCGIYVDSAAYTRIDNNLIESNNSGWGSLFGGDNRPGIGVKILSIYGGGFVSGGYINNNYFENQFCEVRIKAAYALVENNSLYGTFFSENSIDSPQVVMNTNVWTTGYRMRILNNSLYSGKHDGILYIGGRENEITGNVVGTGSTRNKLESGDLQGNSEHIRKAFIRDTWLDGTDADSEGPRIHDAQYYNQLATFNRMPFSVQNIQVKGGKYGYGDGWDAVIHKYGAGAPTTQANCIEGDLIWNEDPDAGDELGWICTETGSQLTIAPAITGTTGETRINDLANVDDTDTELTSSGGMDDYEWIGRMFVAATTGRITSASLVLGRTGAPAGTCYLEVYTDSASFPSVSRGGLSNTVAANALNAGAGGAIQEFVWSANEPQDYPQVTAGSTYWLVLKTNDYVYNGGVLEIRWRTDANGAMGIGECAKYDSDAATKWTTMGADVGADITIIDYATLVVTDAADLKEGCWVDIAGVAGPNQIVEKLAGGLCLINPVADAVVGVAAVTNHEAAWERFGVIGDNLIAARAISGSAHSQLLGVGVTTFAISSNYEIVTGDGGGNVIATITGGIAGQQLTLEFVDALVTITDNDAHAADSCDLSGVLAPAADDLILILSHNGTCWMEVSRSAN